jgi:hypothetical protein
VGRRGILTALYLTTLLKPSLRRLTPAPLTAFQPDWSPDGNDIAFSSHVNTPQNKEIWVTNVETHSFRRLTHHGNDFFNDPQDFHLPGHLRATPSYLSATRPILPALEFFS